MEWNIKARSESCQITGRAFLDEEWFYTVLNDTVEGVQRQDLSEEAWAGFQHSPDELSFWKSQFKASPAAASEAVGKEDAESELRRLLSKPEEGDAKVCFLLALLLERKRILKARERYSKDGRRHVLYEHMGTQETFIVPEVEFKLSELDSLRDELTTQNSRIFTVSLPAEAVVEVKTEE
ncbi:MAG: hypothetical protein HC904_04965 [Blastochloris sp.]|nr:hypothetical protein [Blastochloris sp.]